VDKLANWEFVAEQLGNAQTVETAPPAETAQPSAAPSDEHNEPEKETHT
jgi:hypothetical protein